MAKTITVAICNFNTTDLTNNCIKSICIHCKKSSMKFVILDNSDIQPFVADSMLNNVVQVIDNTNGKFINFKTILSYSPYRLMPFNANNFGSLKHACSIQFLLNICQTDYMLLFDSDTILLKELDFISNEYVTAADLEEHGKLGRNGKMYMSYTRTLPFIQFFNVKIIKDLNIKYFDYARIHGVLAPNKGNYYDTGASFYADIQKLHLPIYRINHTDYIKHLNHGSWIDKFNRYLK